MPSWQQLSLVLIALTVVLVYALMLTSLPPTRQAYGQGGYALRFYGSGATDIDRVKIPLGNGANQSLPVNVSGDFTLEFWMKASASENPSGTCTASSSAGDGWIFGHVIFDRDIDNALDYGDYGISLYNGRLGFGVANSNGGGTICGTRVVTNGQWRHIAVTRNNSSGQLRIYVDGQLDVQGSGPSGRIDYRIGRNSTRPNSDPFLVIAAEKHDYNGVLYYSGLIDDVRLSNSVRYSSNFTRPSGPHQADSSTVALYRFDEGSGTTVADTSGASGGPSNGQLRVGGSPAGPTWSSDTPFSASQPTPTATQLIVRDQFLYVPMVLQ